MLFFSRASVAKKIENGLVRQDMGFAEAPKHTRVRPSGAFISVPMLDETAEIEQYLQALRNECQAALGNTPLAWAELEGQAVNAMSAADIQRVVQAAGAAGASVGMSVNLRYLVSGALAGYRSVGVERFTFRVDDAALAFEEPVRRARAMGAFVTVELCCGKRLGGAKLIMAAKTAVAAKPAQICLRPPLDVPLDYALLERAATELCASGFARNSLWMFSQTGQHFDALALRMSGSSVGLGPGEVTCAAGLYQNPPMQRWLQTRLEGCREVMQIHGRLQNYLSLAGGLYGLRVYRDSLGRSMLSTASRLQRLGAIDSTGVPKSGWPMEFSHRVACAAWKVFDLPEGEP